MSADPGPAHAQLGVCFSLQVRSGCQGWGGTSQALGLCLIQWLSLTHPALPRRLGSSAQSQKRGELGEPRGEALGWDLWMRPGLGSEH